MSAVKISSSAMKDIEKAGHRSGVPMARKDIVSALHRLGETPNIGTAMFPRNTQYPYLYLRLDPYLIVYESASQDSIRVLRVLYLKHSDIALLFNDNPCKMVISAKTHFKACYMQLLP